MTRSPPLLVAAFALALASPAHAGTEPDLRLPPGTRRDPTQGSNAWVSGRGLRDTTDLLAAELRRRGIAARQIGPAAVRGVELTRFLSDDPATAWLAVHVLRTAGKTWIFLVPRTKSAQALDESPPAG
jgi:hypothetical protein